MNEKWFVRFGGLLSGLLATAVFGAVWSFSVAAEVPVGGLKGQAMMMPAVKALPHAEVVLYPDFDVPEGSRSTWVTKTDDQGRFSFKGLPTGLYTVNVYGKAFRNQRENMVLVKEGKTEDINVALTRPDSELDLHANQRVFLPTEPVTVTLSGYTNEANARFEVSQVPYNSVFSQKSPENLVRSLTANKNDSDPGKTAGLLPYRSEARALARKDIEGHFVEQIELKELPQGLYLVKATVGKESKYSWVTVTTIALVTKAKGGKGLGFVTDLSSGKPVAGAQLSVMSGSGLRPLSKTSADGVATFDGGPQSGDLMVLVADANGARAFTWSYPGEQQQGRTVLWAQTDRPVYRPGDTVNYKVVGRDMVGDQYNLPTGELEVQVVDPDETVVKTDRLTFSADGTAHGSFKTDPQALPQAYQLRMSHGDSSETSWVSLVSYRKPEFRVTVVPQRKTYVRGETASFEIRAESYTGEPVPGLTVSGSLYERADWSRSPFDSEEYYDDEDYESDYLGDYVQAVEGTTDEQGVLVVKVPTGKSVTETQFTTDAVFSLEADVGDASGRTSTGRGSCQVFRGLYDLRIESDRNIVDPGAPVTLTVKGVLNADKTPVSGVTATIEYGHHRWSKSKSTFIVDGKQDVTLNAQGEASVTVKPDVKGEFEARVSARDQKGNQIEDEVWVWVETGGGQWNGPVEDISIVLDKKLYKPSETAKVLIRTAHPGGTALVTVEAETVLWSKTVALDSNTKVVDLDGLSQYAPNAQVSIAYVRDKEFYSDSRNLRVDLVEKRLNVQVTSDRKEVHPGESVVYTVKTSDDQGRPVSANVALGVVDESIFAIAEDTNDPLKVFYPRRWSSVQTAYSFPVLYLDGEDKNPVAVRVRKDFHDTAYWAPEVVTDSSGVAKVSVKLPDNLTEWRATATAFTHDTRIGKSRSGLVSKLDLMARWSLPMFLVEGDTQTVSVRLSNTTDRPLTLELKAESTNAKLSDGATSGTVKVPPRGSVQESWTVTAGDVGSAKFKVTAFEQNGQAKDAEEKTVPILVRGRKETSSFVASTSDRASVSLDISPNAVAATLRIKVSPTLLGSLVQALPSLIDYPYGCTEQTMSRFVPAVLVSRLMSQTGYHDPVSEARLPQIVRDSLVRVKRLQTGDGGWGWWEYDPPDEWMTAYVLEGLWRVRAAGVDVSAIDIDRALEWSEKRIKDSALVPKLPGMDNAVSDRVALACSVLLFRKSEVALTTLFQHALTNKASTASLATAVTTLKRTGFAPEKLPRLYQLLLSRAEETRDTMHWPDTGWYEGTGTALEALAVMEPDSTRVEKAFRYLQASRRGDSWTSTRDTARILVSATSYLAKTKELAVDEDVNVQVNGRTVLNRRFSRSDLTASPATVTIPLSGLNKGSNAISVTGKGTGRIYLSAELTQDVRLDQATARATPDFTFERAFYRSTPRRLEDGTLRLVVGNRPVESAQTGEVLRCRITVTAKRPLSNIIAEVPVPSNMRILEDEEPLDGATWDWWWSRSVFTDDRAVFFGDVEAGKPQVIEFAVRAESPGRCCVLPASLYRMYQPDDKAWTSSGFFEVKPR